MKDSRSIDIKRLKARAQLPRYLRLGTFLLLGIVVAAIVIGFYRSKSNAEFRMTGFPTELSKDVIATAESYERREIEGDSVRYFIKADRAFTFADNHQELENVYLQIFDEDGAFNEITSGKAVYVPEGEKNFTGYFAGGVMIRTRDGISLNTDEITYKKVDDTALSEEKVTFVRANIRGSAFGAAVNMAQRTLVLNRNVELAMNGVDRIDTLNSGNAVYFQESGVVELGAGVRFGSVAVEDNAEKIEASSQRGKLNLTVTTAGQHDMASIELFDSVGFTRTVGPDETRISASAAVYDRQGDHLKLKDGVNISTIRSGKVVRNLNGDIVEYFKGRGRTVVVGNVEMTTGTDMIKGDKVDAEHSVSDLIKRATVTGNAYLRQTRENETTEVSAGAFTAVFNDSGEIASAVTNGGTELKQKSAEGQSSSLVTVNAANQIDAVFRSAGAFERLKTDGRTTISLETPNNGRDSSNKQVVADSITTSFNPDGRSFKRAEAVGNAEFISIPHNASESNFKVKVNSPRFDCDFQTKGNTLDVCVAQTTARMTRTPTITRDGHGEQHVSASKLTVQFDQTGGSIARLDAFGKAKFSELDRNALANSFVYTSVDETVRLRGGDVSAWDDRARVKAKEIDWDTKNLRSVHRGSVSSTYYNASAIGSSNFFGSNDKPVYITSDSAEMDHVGETARYFGNARAWQGSSYIRAATLFITQKDSGVSAEGDIQSALFRTNSSGKESAPIFVSSELMNYDGAKRVVRYERNVVIRKGTDRITGRTAIASLNENNEMTATDIENDVVITQPGRKGSSEFARYTNADEKIVLRGRPARVEDPIKGTLTGAELTIYLKEQRVQGTGPTAENPSGRVRNIYKVQ